jgi:hypothetical protein
MIPPCDSKVNLLHIAYRQGLPVCSIFYGSLRISSLNPAFGSRCFESTGMISGSQFHPALAIVPGGTFFAQFSP